MRITNQWKYAQTVYDYQRGMQGVNKHNMQLSSGLKIQNSYESASIYNDAMRLDYEITSLEQIKLATSKSQNFSKTTDRSLQDLSKQLENFKVKLIQAASDIHNKTSLEAIANDLEGIKNHMMSIANTSINGQFLFSGSAVDTKPISENGTYWGNNEQMKTISGSKVEIPFNLNGFDLFLGRDNDYNKTLTTNVKLTDQSRPDVKDAPKYLTEESKIRNLVGLNYAVNKESIEHDYDFLDNTKVEFPDTYFYLQGTKPDGTAFTSKFKMTAGASIRSLMDKIGMEFGNTETSRVVDINMNHDGQIVVKDLTKGNQTINFNLVGVTEQVLNKSDLPTAVANVNNNTSKASVSELNALQNLINNPTGNGVHITDFTKNNFTDSTGKVVDSFDFDKVKLERKDNILSGNISQINRKTGAYATDQTRLSETGATNTMYPNSHDRYNIDNQTISIQVKSRIGTTYDITVKLGTQNPSVPTSFDITGTDKNGGAVFNPATRNLPIYHANEFGEYRTQTNDMTYRQLMDIVAMAASDNIPSLPHAESNTLSVADRKANYEAYNTAINKSKGMVSVELDHRGRIQLTDKSQAITNIEVSIYDNKESGKFYGDSTGNTPATSQGKGAAFSFMQNNAITIDEPSIDLFNDITKMIEAVRLGHNRSDSESNDPRNTGIQGAIERIGHIMDHVNKEKVKIGSYTNLLKDTNERASLMKVNVASVKSEVIDADYAESYLSLTQKMMSYQAMLQATSKINQLSLLNYM